MTDLEKLKLELRDFNNDRDWDQFHSPTNLAKSIAIEAGELLECFQWDDAYDKAALSDEIADVMCYCIMLADKIDIDLPVEIERKIRQNGEKYPVKQSKGSSRKYDVLKDLRE